MIDIQSQSNISFIRPQHYFYILIVKMLLHFLIKIIESTLKYLSIKRTIIFLFAKLLPHLYFTVLFSLYQYFLLHRYHPIHWLLPSSGESLLLGLTFFGVLKNNEVLLRWQSQSQLQSSLIKPSVEDAAAEYERIIPCTLQQ